MTKIAATILAIALLAAMAQPALAQEASANVTGKITDPSGGAIAGATVTAKDVDRGTTFRTQTSAEGVYTLPRLPIGSYAIGVESSGFQTAVRSLLSLVLNQTATIDIAMTIGQVSQQVEVSDVAPV